MNRSFSPREFSEEEFGGFFVSLGGFFSCIKRANPYFYIEPTSIVVDALWFALTNSGDFVHAVLRLTGFSEIGNSVIMSDTVDVINIFEGVAAGDHFPNDTVCQKNPSAPLNFNIPICSSRPGRLASMPYLLRFAPVWLRFPSKSALDGVTMKKFVELLKAGKTWFSPAYFRSIFFVRHRVLLTEPWCLGPASRFQRAVGPPLDTIVGIRVQ